MIPTITLATACSLLAISQILMARRLRQLEIQTRRIRRR